MSIEAKPPAEVAIDPPLVVTLLQEQHGDLAHLSLIEAGEGWDNKLFRLGDDLTVRMPRRAASAALIEHEQRWLPELSQRLPLPVPVPVRVGRAGCGFPWAWSVVPWFRGHTALLGTPADFPGRPSSSDVFFTHSIDPHRRMRQSTRGEACPSRVVLRGSVTISSGSGVS